jgi:hypothetical protein
MGSIKKSLEWLKQTKIAEKILRKCKNSDLSETMQDLIDELNELTIVVEILSKTH